METENVLCLENIRKVFPQPEGEADLVILDCVNLAIARATSVSIMGKSGSGKSTLLSLAALLEKPTKGSVIWMGKESESLSDGEKALLRRSNMGFVFQNSLLMEDFTALENVMFPLLISGKGKKEATREAKELLSYLHLDSRLSHTPHTLSGGERQRVAIARALICHPALVFADEPTGALDEEAARLIEDLLLSVVEKMETSLLLVTHNRSFATRCHQCYNLEKGVLSLC